MQNICELFCLNDDWFMRQIRARILDEYLALITVGDGSLICPLQVHKITPPPPGVSWASRHQELNVEHKYSARHK